MEKKHLGEDPLFESLYLWAASLGIGILLGVLLYRLLFLVLMKLTGLNGTIGLRSVQKPWEVRCCCSA